MKFDGYRILRDIVIDNTKTEPSVGSFDPMLEREATATRSERAKMAPDATGLEYRFRRARFIDDAGYPGPCRDGGVHDTGALYPIIPPDDWLQSGIGLASA